MATNYISYKLRTYLAQRFKSTFVQENTYHTGFIFIGKSLEYANGSNSVETITDTVYDEKTVWDNMIVAKKINPGDVELVIPRYNWISGEVYKQYDDRENIEDLLTEDTLKPMYVYTPEGNVYKCLSNNLEKPSVEMPTGNYTSANGVIRTSDDYIWKYMYNVSPTNKFLANTWIPVPYSTDKGAIQTEYLLDTSNLVDGGLNTIVVTNPGSGYVHTNLEATAFAAGQDYLTVSNTSNLAVNMSVKGTGIFSDTYITSVSQELNRIYLSYPTIANGGGAGNTINILTRVVIDGDGTGVSTEVILSNTQIQEIVVSTDGSNYTKANVQIYGSGSNAAARAILSPKYGHGYSPALELNSTSVFLRKIFGEVDSSEGGLIPTTTTFRQYGILLDPHKYGSDEDIVYANANTVLTLTTNVTLLSGVAYTTNEKVYQGTLSKPTFVGYVNSQETGFVRLNNTFGELKTGSLLIGANSGVSRTVVTYTTPQLQPYSGDILYVQNATKVQRYSDQSEEIKFIIKF